MWDLSIVLDQIAKGETNKGNCLFFTEEMIRERINAPSSWHFP